MTVRERTAALQLLAQGWQDPDHDVRANSIEAMLEVDERFTEEGLAFVLNHRMNQFGSESALNWLGEEDADASLTIGVTPVKLDPLGGLEAAVAALVLGHRVILEDPAPLVAAFADSLADEVDGDVAAASRDGLLGAAGAWIVYYCAEEALEIEAVLTEASLPEARIYAVALEEAAVVLDGREDHGTLSALAEDLLLHEGLAPGTPRIVWAPTDTAPDALLNALAGFRELYPAHPDTDGTFALPTAFLAAAQHPHATGPGFLVSLGVPEAQTPGHIRWSEYGDLDEVKAWVRSKDAPGVLVATDDVAERLAVPGPILSPGDIHRPDLDPELPSFLRSL